MKIGIILTSALLIFNSCQVIGRKKTERNFSESVYYSAYKYLADNLIENPRKNGFFSSEKYYSIPDECSLLFNADNSSILARINKKLDGPFWVLIYEERDLGRGPRTGGVSCLFIDDETKEILDVYHII